MSKEELQEFYLEVRELRKDAKRMSDISNMENDCDLGDITDELNQHLDQFNA